MKKIIFLFFAAFIFSGCTYTANTEAGNKFDESKVSQIVKGKTTEQELISMFGQPFMKTVLNETDVKWLYSFTVASASSQAFMMKTTSNGVTKTLDILVKNGIVLNYAYTETPISTSINK